MAYGTIRADVIQGTNTSINLGTAGQFDFGGDLSPTTNSTYDLGTNALRWANVYANNVYTNDLHLKNDRGDWTLIEEEEFLTLRNNVTGKTFKLLMEEIN